MSLTLFALPGRGEAQSALVLFGYGAHFTPLSSLSTDGDDFAPSLAYGLGAAIQVGKSVAFRASGTVVKTTYRGDAIAVSDSAVLRVYAMVDVQLGFPNTSTLVPYVVIGGGFVRSDFANQGVATTSYPAVRLGGGVNHVSSFGAFFLEVSVTGHRHTGVPFSSTQMDVGIHLGVAIALLKIG